MIREFRRYNWNIQPGHGVQERVYLNYTVGSGSTGEWAVRRDKGNLDDILQIHKVGRSFMDNAEHSGKGSSRRYY